METIKLQGNFEGLKIDYQGFGTISFSTPIIMGEEIGKIIELCENYLVFTFNWQDEKIELAGAFGGISKYKTNKDNEGYVIWDIQISLKYARELGKIIKHADKGAIISIKKGGKYEFKEKVIEKENE